MTEDTAPLCLLYAVNYSMLIYFNKIKLASFPFLSRGFGFLRWRFWMMSLFIVCVCVLGLLLMAQHSVHKHGDNMCMLSVLYT